MCAGWMCGLGFAPVAAAVTGAPTQRRHLRARRRHRRSTKLARILSFPRTPAPARLSWCGVATGWPS